MLYGAVLFSLLLAGPIAEPQTTNVQDIARTFAYDQGALLDLQEKAVEDQQGSQVH